MRMSTVNPYRRTTMGGLFDTISSDLSRLSTGLSDLSSTYINYQAAQSAINAQNAPAPTPLPAPRPVSATPMTIAGMSLPVLLLLGAGAWYFMKKKRRA